MYTERLGGDEEILIMAEPFASLTEEGAERTALSGVFCGSTEDGLENAEYRLVLIP
jgi:hypothetical protein